MGNDISTDATLAATLAAATLAGSDVAMALAMVAGAAGQRRPASSHALIASGSQDKTVKVWDVCTGQLCRTWQAHEDWVTCCAFSPDGSTLVTGSKDKLLKVWDLQTGQLRHTLKGHSKAVVACGISRNGATIVSGSVDLIIKVWDLYTGKLHQSLSGMDGFDVFHPYLSECMMARVNENTLQIWDVRSFKLRHTLKEHVAVKVLHAASPDGTTLVSTGNERPSCQLKVWDGATGIHRHTLAGHTGVVQCLSISPDSTTVVSASQDKTLKVWDLATGVLCHTLVGHTGSVRLCAVSPDDRAVVSWASNAECKVWDLATGQLLHTLAGTTSNDGCFRFGPDGTTLAAGSLPWHVKVWDLRSGKLLHSMSGHTGGVMCCAISAGITAPTPGLDGSSAQAEEQAGGTGAPAVPSQSVSPASTQPFQLITPTAPSTPQHTQPHAPTGGQVPAPSITAFAQRLLDAISRWPERLRSEREAHLSIVTSCVQQMREELGGLWIEPQHLKLEGVAGQGGFAVVQQATWRGQDVALKRFRPFDTAWGRTLVQSFVKEACLLSQLSHRSVVHLHGFTADLKDGWLGLVLEWAGESLDTIMEAERKGREAASPEARLQWAAGVAEGLLYLHSQQPRIVHRDLKSHNVMISRWGGAKLIDFGISQALQQTYLTVNHACSHAWMAPEVLAERESTKGLQLLSSCNEKCDVYSFGVLLAALATGQEPWEGRSVSAVVADFTRGARLSAPELGQPWLQQLIQRCLAEEPANRPSMEQVLRVLQEHKAQGIICSKGCWPVCVPSSHSAPGVLPVMVPAAELWISDD